MTRQEFQGYQWECRNPRCTEYAKQTVRRASSQEKCIGCSQPMSYRGPKYTEVKS